MVHWLVVTLAVWGRVAAAMEQVGDQRDLTFKIKTNDALVVFVGEKKGSQEEATFRQVAQDMAPDGGIMFAVAFDAKIAQKYRDSANAAGSYVAAFTNYDPETGHSKKHVKGKAFTDEFDYSALYTWAYAEALPCVTRIPINMGPDASKRNRIAMSGGLPKLFRFAKSMLGKDPEAKDADGAFLRAIAAARLKGKATVLGVEVQGGEHDEGLSYLENFGFDEDDIGEGKLIMATTGGGTDEYDGDVGDEAAIMGWAERAVAATPPWRPTARTTGAKKRKKKKKREL